MGLVLALCCFPARAFSYPHDAQLSARLKTEFKIALSSGTVGPEVYARFKKAGQLYSGLRVLVRKDASDCFAWYDPARNAVYFNSRFILKFFEAKGFKDPQVVEVLWSNKKVRSELIKYCKPVYLHELVHALQCYFYPEYRRDAGANPLEFEYEAYLTEDMYVHERMKADPRLLRDFVRGDYTDIYTANIFGSYLALSLDPERYRERIRRFYEEELGGYISMEEAGAAKKNEVADARIFAYAAGNTGKYTAEGEALARLETQKAAYARFLKDFYSARWQAFSSDALLFVGSTALEEKNYPLALDCLAVADANSLKYGLAPGTLETLKIKGAVAVLEAASFIRDNAGKMGLEVLSQHLKALEKACAATSRPFPEDLLVLKAATYPKALVYYAGKYGAEKESYKKDYYRENLEYFSASTGPATAEEQ